jgi:hypothetical protein
VIDTWSRLSTRLGQRVTLSCNKRRCSGNCIGVDPEKCLILRLDRGGVRIFDAAHTHIVKQLPRQRRRPAAQVAKELWNHR